MQRLFPDPAEEARDDVYADLADQGELWTAVGMVTSIDGAATISGRSGKLGEEGDLAAFRGLRAAADIIVVGAGTARIEGYGPPRMRDVDVERRQARGQALRPSVAVVSNSLDLSGAERLLDAERDDWSLLVITHQDADPSRRRTLEGAGAKVVSVGAEEVDLAAMLSELREMGYGRILCEGGPSLNGRLFAAGLVDELFVTIAPAIVGGEGPRIVAGLAAAPVDLTLVSVRRHADELLLRYRVDR